MRARALAGPWLRRQLLGQAWDEVLVVGADLRSTELARKSSGVCTCRPRQIFYRVLCPTLGPPPPPALAQHLRSRRENFLNGSDLWLGHHHNTVQHSTVQYVQYRVQYSTVHHGTFSTHWPTLCSGCSTEAKRFLAPPPPPIPRPSFPFRRKGRL